MRPRWILRFLSVLVVAFLSGCVTVPITGRQQFLLTTPQQELRLGVLAYREALAKGEVVSEPVWDEVLERVGRRIAAATGKRYRWEFHILNSRQINAWCLPGGKIAVYTGILPIVKSEAGLAAVLGHEVAHAIARHSGERITQQLLVKTGLSITQLTVSLESRDERLTRDVTNALGATMSVGVLLPFSRAHESEADHMGLIYMARAGYDPREAVRLWRRMHQATAGLGRPPEFLSTHPADETRIRQLQRWMPEALAIYEEGAEGGTTEASAEE